MQDNTIKIIGVGGTGCNIINQISKAFLLKNIDIHNLIAMNTDLKSLETCNKDIITLKLGEDGLGAGSNPQKGIESAEFSKDDIIKILQKDETKLIIICAGLGGGTGSGASIVVAQIAKELNIQVISIVTTPFVLEGKLRQNIATRALEDLQKYSDIYVTISNEALSQTSTGRFTLKQTFERVDQIYIDFIVSLFKMLYEPASIGSVNTDFSDVIATINGKGKALLGTGFARGDDAALLAITQALNNPLLQVQHINQASNVLIYIFGNYIEIDDIRVILQGVYDKTGEEVLSIFGDRIFNTNGSEYDGHETDGKWIRVMILITGIVEGSQIQQQKETIKPTISSTTQTTTNNSVSHNTNNSINIEF